MQWLYVCRFSEQVSVNKYYLYTACVPTYSTCCIQSVMTRNIIYETKVSFVDTCDIWKINSHPESSTWTYLVIRCVTMS